MRQLLAVSMFTFVVAVGAMLWDSRKTAGANARTAASPSPVVVELFTSEGCSSCPPADALLVKLTEKQRLEKEQIIALEEHVDYWDQLGWRDPFSSAEWTGRQESYAAAFGNGSVYTPQMVVDGRTEFAGSREWEARRVIEEMAGKAKVDVRVTPAETGKDRAQFTVHVGKLTGMTGDDIGEVLFAITETGLHSAVTRGENAGEDLHHAAVVRTLRRIGVANAKDAETAFAGEASVSFDRSWKRDNLRAVVFVQEKKSRKILGAAEIKVTPYVQ
ncbi:MAG: DUF1223 domain-containing protein [Candidatus Acidiferrales bacterium]